MKKIAKLTDLEITIMGVIWDHEERMTVNEIAECLKESCLSPASINQAMNRLIKKKVVTVVEFVRVSNVYARTFQPCVSREEYINAEIRRLGKKISYQKKINSIGMIAAFLANDSEDRISQQELTELQEVIEKRKKRMRGEEE